MYKEGVDILYQAAGSTGAGVFQEAKARNENDYRQRSGDWCRLRSSG